VQYFAREMTFTENAKYPRYVFCIQKVDIFMGRGMDV
jgi:hypothetical protein